MSPAVLTETIWALAHETPAVVPERIVIVTTAAGRAVLMRELFETPFGQSPSVWVALRESLAAEGLDLTGLLGFDRRNDLRELALRDSTSGESQPLEDIRTAHENEAAADFILRELRGLTDDDSCRLIGSIAGGRKTMGSLLCAAVSLVGRDRDRLTHVLVNSPFDDPRLTPRFYFPGQPIGGFQDAAGKSVEIEPVIQLADIPFVPLRDVFPRELGRRPGRFTELVNSYNHNSPLLTTAPLEVVLRRLQPRCEINRIEVPLSPVQALILHFLARRLHENAPPIEKYATAFAEIARVVPQLREEFGHPGWLDEISVFLRSGGDGDRALIKTLDDLRSKLKRRSGDAARVLQALPQKGRFSLKIPRECMRVID
jgi:CRISPR-associated protein (TIGR02584 family)